MNQRRLCLGCLEDWIDVGESLCIMCTYEHEQAMIRIGKVRNRKSTEWWGPAESDLDDGGSESKSLHTDGKNYGLPWGYHLVEAI